MNELENATPWGFSMELSIFPGSDQNPLHSYLQETKCCIDSELAKLLSSIPAFSLRDKIEYAVLSSGKRLRPSLVLLSAESVGAKKQNLIRLALTVELMHTATLIHDDILDRDVVRRNMPTLQAKWSMNEAILVGDALVAMALNLAADYGGDILKILGNAGLLLCEGEYLDSMPVQLPLSEDHYLYVISKKCASLFRAAAEIGAIAGGGSRSDVKSLAEFGEHFGMAFQINDDLSELTFKEGGIPTDLMEGRATLPLIHLYGSLEKDEKEALLKNLRSLNSADLLEKEALFRRILEVLEKQGSIEYCRDRICHFVNRSIMDLSPLREGIHRGYLAELAQSLVPASVNS
jgi:geranylgeranyl pyrophosphate synthase